MLFHDIDTQLTYFRRHLPDQVPRGGPAAFYDRMMRSGCRFIEEAFARDRGVLTRQLMTEWSWYEGNCPYFLMHPGLVDSLAKMRMDIPAKLIQFPTHPKGVVDRGGLMRAFVMRFPTENNPMSFEAQSRLPGANWVGLTEPTTHYVRGIMAVYQDRAYLQRYADKYGFVPHFGEDQEVIVWIDIGERDVLPGLGWQSPVWTYRALMWSGDETVEEAQSKLPDSSTINEGVLIPREVVQKCIRLVLSVCFLMRGDSRLVRPVVLGKDAGSSLPLAELQRRAVRAGQYGWRVGYDSMFSAEPRAGAGTGEGLKWAHVRGMHWHQIRFGPGKANVRVDLFMDTIVRPDLPFKPPKSL